MSMAKRALDEALCKKHGEPDMLRVPPEIAGQLVRYISNYGLKVTWKEVEQDSHRHFTGSEKDIAACHAFVKGWEYCKESA